ncbi:MULTISPECIES: ABC transporter ATP-binding protein [Alcaligenes]|jgi:NitT/TauT family transport system ATP-binding protein|uniref:Nitrate ABC transporter ATP-binding protein n=2 Tax=Alcaligenes TaxID=507 RepID=A0AB33CQR0_ALCFA|nr:MULTISPECIES: ABC transporter ATP-binding protein [Alcaligenes]ASR88237.1 nitrate ABC transporter ATP-binding protein [Alcaligenes faecalis]AWG36043.1 nitrate ABC transporter ATP-binding protein [Alcaligenes aquatilis]MCC9163401.1 ABC transporter ATP-binding protein [Alcaligenes sp. MMA]MCH4224280.1 ABC transporter ATP-binding protein [Alcaligenes faecalis]QXR36240.1 ABC transporter ATP-binding protein [Alcaligenes aquatilis]
MIELDGVGKTFNTRQGHSHTALQDIALSIPAGRFVSILGPSGCGKSTLLYMLGGFESCSSGQIRVKGKPITGPGPDRGPVFQEYALFPWKTVLGNVAYGMREQGMPKAQAEQRASEWLDKVKLGPYAAFYPRELSGGMRQRAAIARTLAYEPDILLMDEPFGALDAHTRVTLQTELLSLWEQLRNTVVFVTHGVDEAVFLSDTVIVMTGSPGRIKEVVEIDLPRPRIRSELLRNPVYQETIIRLEQSLMAEAHP